MKNKTIFLILLAVILNSCNSINNDYEKDYNTNWPTNFNIIEIPLLTPELDPSKYAPTHKMIELEIQGNKIPFIFDTGDFNSTIVLSKNIIGKLSFTETGYSSKRKSLYGNYNRKEILMDNISFENGITINSMPCEISDTDWFWPWNIEYENIGTVGWGFFRNFNVEVNYSEEMIRLYPKSIFVDGIENYQSFSLDETEVGFVFNSEIDNKKVKLIIDSGAGVYNLSESQKSIFLDALFSNTFKRISKNTDNIEKGLLGDYFNQKVKVENGNIYSKFGLLKVPLFLNLEYDGFLGWNFFREYHLFFDNQNNILYYKQ